MDTEQTIRSFRSLSGLNQDYIWSNPGLNIEKRLKSNHLIKVDTKTNTGLNQDEAETGSYLD